jgi:hypothetical protein
VVFSVGGSHLEKNLSGNIVHAVRRAKKTGARLTAAGNSGLHSASISTAVNRPGKTLRPSAAAVRRAGR